MKNTKKSVRLLATLSLFLVLLELSTIMTMPLNEESMKLDEISSGQTKNNDKDDDLFGGESDKGSGDSIILDQPESPVQSSLLNDKQVDKLIQAEDLGLNGLSDSETSGKLPNNVPDFKDSSKEEPAAIFSPSDNSNNQKLTDENSMESDGKDEEKVAETDKIAVGDAEFADDTAPKQSVILAPPQETMPVVAAAAAVQPEVTINTAPQEAQSFSSANSAPVQPQAPVGINTQLEVTVDTTPNQSQSFSQTMTPEQQGVQPAVATYSAGGAQTADSSAAQQTFDNAALQQADYQDPAISAFNGQQPAEITNSAAQQWDAPASAAPQADQQYNDAAALSPQPVQTSKTEGKSHTIQLDDEKYRTLICQNGKDTISCPPNQQISVRSAEYGSMGASACLGKQSFTPSPFCKTPGAYDIVKSNCDDMENCELMANDDLFGEECETDKKYLDLEYDCVPSQSPASPYQGSFPPQAMYPAQQPAAPQYPGAQQGYPPSPYQGYTAPQGYGQEQQQGFGQEQEQLNQMPPAPKLPELMSTLLAMSQKSQASSQQQCATQCSSCNQCSATPVCHPCPVCQSSACTVAPSVPYIPKGLRPLWELWNEKTAGMNKMEMSALIISPVPKLPPTKKSSSLTESEGSGDENSEKRSHLKSTKKSARKSSRKTKDMSKHPASKAAKSIKHSKKNTKSGSKAKHS